MMEEDPGLGLYLMDKEPRTSLVNWYRWKLRYDQRRRWKWRCHSWYSHQCWKPWYRQWYFVAWLLRFVNRGSEKSERLVCTEENGSTHLHLLCNNSSQKVICCVPHGDICWCQWLKQKDEEIAYETVSYSHGVKYNSKLTCGKCPPDWHSGKQFTRHRWLPSRLAFLAFISCLHPFATNHHQALNDMSNTDMVPRLWCSNEWWGSISWCRHLKQSPQDSTPFSNHQSSVKHNLLRADASQQQIASQSIRTYVQYCAR